MSDFSKLKVKKNGKECILNVCTQDTEQDIIGTKNFSKLTVNGKNIVRSVNGLNADTDGNVQLGSIGAIDWNSQVSFVLPISKSDTSVSYTAPESGVVFVTYQNYGGRGDIYVNDIVVFQSMYSNSRIPCILILDKGDTLRIVYANEHYANTSRFYPFK